MVLLTHMGQERERIEVLIEHLVAEGLRELHIRDVLDERSDVKIEWLKDEGLFRLIVTLEGGGVSAWLTSR